MDQIAALAAWVVIELIRHPGLVAIHGRANGANINGIAFAQGCQLHEGGYAKFKAHSLDKRAILDTATALAGG